LFALGLEPFLPIFQRGILYGSPEIREVSAAGLGEVIALTSSTYLDGPLIIKMTGPLLRIVGDRNPANVKVAILRTLGLILTKGGPALRAFVPQFQTTFVKALSDPSRQVRLAAIKALALLMPLTTRVDPLIKELVTGALGSSLQVEGVAAASIQHATLEALAVVVSTCGTKVKLPASITSTLDASKELLSHPDTGVREAAAKVLGETCALLPLDVIIDTVQKVIVDTTDDSSSEARHGKMCATRRILQSSVGTQVMATIPELKDRVYECLKDDKIAVREAAVVALGALIGRYNNNDHRKAFAPHERELASCLDAKQESLEVQSAAARGLCVALSMIDGTKRVDSMGLQLIDMSLKLALGGAQRVQFAFNEVLWLALDVQNGEEGLNRYCNIAVFDNIRSMKSLYTKILSKMTEASALND
jgi:HEAT repeat protein